jgi:trigger factor
VQVTSEQIDPCKVALTITVEPEQVKAAKDKAFRQIASNLQIPGFRKGKVPPQFAKQYIDPARVSERAAEALVGPAYSEALTEAQVEPFGNLNPELELVEFPEDGAFVFKAYVPTRPVVTLGPYKGLEVERRRLQVTDKDIDDQIEEARTRRAEYPEITDRPVQTGDIVLADLTVTVEGEALEGFAEPRSTVIEVGKNIPDFDNGLVGIAIGETKTIDAVYPEEYADENLRGKRATFEVSVKELRAKMLPELNEEFVQKAHPTAKTVDELRTALRETLEKAAEEMAENDLEFQIVGKIVQNSQISFPEQLLRAEMQADVNALNERLQRENATVEQYLEATGQSQEMVEAGMAQSADRRIRNSLVLSEVARAENITVEDEDVDKVLNERAERAKVSASAVRAYAEKNNQMNQFRDQALTTKILDYLKGTSQITERSVTAEEMDALAEQNETESGALPQDDDTDESQNTDITETPAPAAPLSVQSAAPRRRGAKTAATGTSDAPVSAESAEENTTETAEDGTDTGNTEPVNAPVSSESVQSDAS